jgi:hypothetical protein
MADYNSSLPVRSEGDAHEKLQTKIVDYNTPAQGLAIDASGNISAKLLDDTGTAFSSGNPLYVSNVAAPTIKYNSYQTSASVASNASVNHDYTALAAIKLLRVHASGSGKIKAEVKVETGVGTGVYNTFFVEFNSTSSPNIQIPLDAPISVASGVKIRVTLTNRDNQAQDVYSTVSAEG